VYVHVTDVRESGVLTLTAGNIVEFDIGANQRTGKAKAKIYRCWARRWAASDGLDRQRGGDAVHHRDSLRCDLRSLAWTTAAI
jgi:hypothetical protein